MIAIGTILGAALLLRVAAIGREGLWLDEILSWHCASGDLNNAFQCEANKPPFYYPLLYFWVQLFGTSETSLRAMSVLPSLASVWLMYRLGTQLFSLPVGLAAAGYQAVSTFQIYYAQEARNYSWFVFFMLLAADSLWKAVNSAPGRTRTIRYAVYALWITLSLFTHFVAIFFVGGHGIYILLRRRRHFFPAAAAIGGACLVISPWLVHMFRTPGATDDGSRRYFLLKVPQAYFSFMFGDTLIPLDEQAVQNVRAVLRSNWWILALALSSGMLLLPWIRQAWKRWKEPMWFVLIMAAAPVLLALMVSLKNLFFDERRMIPTSSFVYLAVAAAVCEIAAHAFRDRGWTWRLRAGVYAAGAYAVLLGLSLYFYYFNPRFGKEQWREATAYIESAAPPGQKDLIVFFPDYLRHCYRYYQKRDYAAWPIRPEAAPELTRSPGVVRDRARDFRTVWLVRSHFENPELVRTFREAFRETGYRHFQKAKGIEVFSFDTASAGSGQSR